MQCLITWKSEVVWPPEISLPRPILIPFLIYLLTGIIPEERFVFEYGQKEIALPAYFIRSSSSSER